MVGVKRVIIIRHGETDYNVSHRWQGQLDVPLNANGYEQARLLAEYLKSMAIDAIYSSDLERAYETARAVAAVQGLDIIKDERLREIHLGCFQGLTRIQLQKIYPEELYRWDKLDRYVIPQGESRQQMRQRIYEAWSDVVRGDGDTVAMVTHGGSIRMLMLELFGEIERNQRYENTSVTILERQNKDSFKIVERGSIKHLIYD